VRFMTINRKWYRKYDDFTAWGDYWKYLIDRVPYYLTAGDRCPLCSNGELHDVEKGVRCNSCNGFLEALEMTVRYQHIIDPEKCKQAYLILLYMDLHTPDGESRIFTGGGLEEPVCRQFPKQLGHLIGKAHGTLGARRAEIKSGEIPDPLGQFKFTGDSTRGTYWLEIPK
jgi:hypothetical protein